MKKLYIISILSLILACLSLASCQKANEPQPRPQAQAEAIQQQKNDKKPLQVSPETAETNTGRPSPESSASIQDDEAVPLITEVMSKEELQAYLKEKGIPIITKANFKEPELVWEKTFKNEGVRTLDNINGLTEAGNSIIITGKTWESDSDKKILFLDKAGNLRKEIDLGKVGENTFAVASSGNAAVIGKLDEQKNVIVISYYDEEGKQLWSKDASVNSLNKVTISDNGQYIGVEEGNPRWSPEEWSAGDLNIAKIVFINSKGQIVYDYKNYRDIGWGEFSGDGNYYAGLFWWQKDFVISGKLIYINVKEGKILWEKRFGGNYWKWGEQFGEDKYLAISQLGKYVAAVDFEPAERLPKGVNEFDQFEIIVFDNQGHGRIRTKGNGVAWIEDNGLFEYMEKRGEIRSIAAIDAPKCLKRFRDFGMNVSSVDRQKMMLYAKQINQGISAPHQLLSFFDEPLWVKHLPSRFVMRFSSDGKYLKGIGGDLSEDKVIFFRISN